MLVRLAPDLRLVEYLHEAHGNPESIAVSTHSAFHHVVDPKFPPNLCKPRTAIPVAHNGGAPDHSQTVGLQGAELGDELVCQAVDHGVIVRILRNVFEREYR